MRILVIDDEKEVRELLAQGLRSKCFAVDVATDGAEGSYLARTNEYDVVVLDNMMPKKSGEEVCKEIRATGNSVPIIMLSVLSDTKQKIELLNAGADDYMIKPFSLEELVARIRALLRRPTKVEGDVLTIDDLELDTTNQSVKRGDESIYLTRKEFMLLEYLLRNQGAVLSRGMIMEHVWDMDSDPFSNTIESHILSLRRKIHLKGSPKLIITVPGRGYKIEVQE